MNKRLEEWAKRITDAESSGLTIRKWCKENGISKGKYYYWHKILRTEGMFQGQVRQSMNEENLEVIERHNEMPGPEFIEIPLPKAGCSRSQEPNGSSYFETQIMIRCGQCQVYIGNGFSAETLARVLEVIA